MLQFIKADQTSNCAGGMIHTLEKVLTVSLTSFFLIIVRKEGVVIHRGDSRFDDPLLPIN